MKNTVQIVSEQFETKEEGERAVRFSTLMAHYFAEEVEEEGQSNQADAQPTNALLTH